MAGRFASSEPVKAEFQPPVLLRNPHVQSMLASVGPRRWLARHRAGRVRATERVYLLDCGDGVRLQGVYNPPAGEPRGLVMLLHGWEGSAHSTYMLNTTRRLNRSGLAVFRLNFRDHGPTHHLNEGIFHSCRLDEVVGAARRVAELIPVRPMYLAGFSLGGNFALRVALRAPEAGIPLTRVVAICPVIHPRNGLHAMEDGVWFYQHYFLRKWRRSLRRKQELFPHRYELSECLRMDSMRELTAWLVEHHSEFATIDQYLDGYAIAEDRLASLEVPSTLLTAEDDPIIPVRDFRDLVLPEHAELIVSPHGGHCGFVEDWRMDSWAEKLLVERLLGGRGSEAPGHAA